jgi:hypothetical protein
LLVAVLLAFNSNCNNLEFFPKLIEGSPVFIGSARFLIDPVLKALVFEGKAGNLLLGRKQLSFGG